MNYHVYFFFNFKKRQFNWFAEILLTTKEVVLFETILDKMVSLTTSDNYLKVIDYIDSSPNSMEIDLSM